MAEFRKTMDLLGDDRSRATSALDRCRDSKYKIESAVSDLSNDIRRFERQLNKNYRRHVRENDCAKKRMKDIGDFKIYPKGVRHGNFPLYTEEGERFELEKPATGDIYNKYVISNSGNNYLRMYSVV